jgi:hypothetical protein
MKRAGIVLVLVCASSLLTPAQDGAGSPAEAQVLALEKVWSQSAERADTKTLQALLDSTLVYIDEDGIVMEKSQFVESMRLPSHRVHKADPGTIVHVYGESALVTGVYRAESSEHGKPFLRRVRFVHTWVSRDGTWVCVSSDATPIQP